MVIKHKFYYGQLDKRISNHESNTLEEKLAFYLFIYSVFDVKNH